jgi:choline dehydrogenase
MTRGASRKASTFDYIIVGAGAAGCVLAYRLSENPAVSVALIEAGGSDDSPYIHMPKGLAKVMVDRAKTWRYVTEPEKGTGFKREFWTRGRMLGGSSSLNGMMYVRGMPADFDEIAARTSDDWSWEKIGAAYRAIEFHVLGSAETRGATGPLRVSLAERRTALTDAMIEAGTAMGLEHKEDPNVPGPDSRIGYAARTIWNGRRQSAVTAFLAPVRNRSNLMIFTRALVDKVNFVVRRAVGISIRSGRAQLPQTMAARRDIVLAAGALASPGILQRSGIGEGKLLQELGIPLLQEMPGVGRHLLEHRGIIMQWRLKAPLSDNREYGGWRLLRNVAQYYLTHGGPMSGGAYEVIASLRSLPGIPRPDVQLLAAPFSFDFEKRKGRLDKFPGMNVAGYPLRPTSRGEIDIRSRDPAILPVLRANYHATAEDRALMIAVVKLARRFVDQEPLRAFIQEETYPGRRCVGDDEILDAYDRNGSCAYHAVGSCRMGSDRDSVVDPWLRVRGVEGLRVMDASIFPQMPSGNIGGPTMAMAWRGAEIIAAGG